jgi:hypothetical protein
MKKSKISFVDFQKHKRVEKTLTVISFILLTAVLDIIATNPTASGYEYSIFYAYPLYFWILFVGIYVSTFLVLFLHLTSKLKTRTWILAFFSILLANFIFLSLFALRGYCFNNGAGADIFSHIGWIRELSTSGFIPETNFYPIFHILVLSLSDILGLSITSIIQYIPAFFSILYPIFIFLLARSLTNHLGKSITISMLSFPLIFATLHTTIHPAFFSFVFLPFLIFLYQKRGALKKKVGMSILIVILCFYIVFFHPMTTLISIIIFSIFIISNFILRKNIRFLKDKKISLRPFKATNVILIFAVSFFVWYTSHSWGTTAIQSIYKNLAYGSDFTIASHYLSTLSMANLTLVQTLRLFFFQYGAILLYSLSALLFLFFVLKKLLILRETDVLEFSLGLQLIAAFFTAGAMIVSNFIVANPIRSLRYFLLIATILNGLFIYSVFYKIHNKPSRSNLLKKIVSHTSSSRFSRKSRIFIPGIYFLLIITIIISMVSVYPTPIIWQTNGHFTYMNFLGSAWMTENRDITLSISGDIGFNQNRMEHYMNGVMNGNIRMKKECFGIPTHFGYDSNESLSQVFNNTAVYLVTSENGRQAVNAFPLNVRHLVSQWTVKDYEKLYADRSVVQIYSNGELEVWKVYGK